MMALTMGMMVMGVGYSGWAQMFTVDHTVELINVEVRGESLVQKMPIAEAKMETEEKSTGLLKAFGFGEEENIERYVTLRANLKDDITELNIINDSEIPVYIDRIEVAYATDNLLKVLEKYSFELAYQDTNKAKIQVPMRGKELAAYLLEQETYWVNPFEAHAIECLERASMLLNLKRNEDLEFLLKDINEKIKEIETQLDEKDKQIKSKNVEIENTKTSMESHKKQIASLQGSIDELDREIADMSSQISHLSSQRQSDTVTTIVPQGEGTSGGAIEPRLVVQEADNSGIDSEISSLASAIKSCESSISEHKKEIVTLNTSIGNEEKVLTELELALKQFEKEKIEIEKILSEKKAERDALIKAFNTDQLVFKIYIKAFNED